MAINNTANAPNVVIQTVSASSSALITCSTLLPRDDTIPQNDEGDEVLTVSITPKSATNILEIYFQTFAVAAQSTLPLALFQDSTANALGSAACSGNGTKSSVFMYRMAAGTTSSTTFKIRSGPSSTPNTLYINGNSGTTDRVFGGVASSILTVTEFQT